MTFIAEYNTNPVLFVMLKIGLCIRGIYCNQTATTWFNNQGLGLILLLSNKHFQNNHLQFTILYIKLNVCNKILKSFSVTLHGETKYFGVLQTNVYTYMSQCNVIPSKTRICIILSYSKKTVHLFQFLLVLYY